jgi:hypothetical protein
MLYLNPIEFNRVNQTFFDTNRLVAMVKQLGIPNLIRPKESGIQSPLSLNGFINSGPHCIEINYLNADTLRIPVVINAQMDDHETFMSPGNRLCPY